MKHGRNDFRLRTRLRRLLVALPFVVAFGGWFGWDYIPSLPKPAEQSEVKKRECTETFYFTKPVSGAQALIDSCLSRDDLRWR